MEKAEFIWLNGEFVAWDEAKIHILTHTLHYGSGVFEGIRFYPTDDGKVVIFRLDEHIDRFLYSAKAINLKLPNSKDEIRDICLKIVKKNGLKSGYIRPLGYYGEKMGLNPKEAAPQISISAWNWGAYLSAEAVKVKISKYIRIHPKSTDSKAKITGHYSNSILASIDATDNGFDEALLLDYEGNVAEGPGENIFYVKDGKLITPSDENILDGLTRRSVMHIAKVEGIEVIEKTVTVDELKNADEAFFTGTAAELSPIAQIDDATIGNGKEGPITEKLKAIYTDAIHGRIDKYSDWLTYV